MSHTDYSFDLNSSIFGGDVDALTTQKRLNRKLSISIDNAKRKQDREEYLRKLHPGLRESWEQYQTLLKLVDK